MPELLSIYQRLPYPFKILAASIRGYHLRWWRYGKDTERWVEEALEREFWSEEQWSAWRQERLSYVLHRAATQVPYYRDYWQQQRRMGNTASWEVLENWPILQKETLRRSPEAFVAEDCDLRGMYCDHTSGTTGTPLKIWQSRKTVRQWYALFEARWRRWYGISRDDRWAILGGQLVTSFDQVKPPFWVWNAGMRQLYCSTYHINQENVGSYLLAMSKYRVKYLLGYPSAIYAMALQAARLKLTPPTLEVIISNAEPLYSYQKQAIQDFFGCPMYDTYGMAENVCAASQCKEGAYHLWPEVGFLEIMQDQSNHPISDGGSGRLICTGLLNADMPLIRYNVGDRGSQDSQVKKCNCGRSLPQLLSIEGRQDDSILTKDGRRIGRLDPIFKTDLHILEAQIIQEEIQKFLIVIVPAPEWGEVDQDVIRERLCQRVGDVEIRFEEVTSIPRSANGKFKAVISKIHELDQRF